MKTSRKNALVLTADVLLANLAVIFCMALRYLEEPEKVCAHFFSYLIGVPILSIFLIVVYRVFGVYRIIWKYARVKDAFKVGVITAVSFTLYMGVHMLIFEVLKDSMLFVGITDWLYAKGQAVERLPMAAYVMGGCLALVFLLGMRLAFKSKSGHNGEIKSRIHKRMMVIGGGSAGNMLLHDLQVNSAFADSKAVCIIDDNPHKIGMLMYGVKIVGNRDTIIENVQKYKVDQIVFAIPTCPPAEKAKILEICTKTGCDVKTVPSLDLILDGKLNMSSIRKVNVEDLLGRDPIKVDIDSIAQYVENKTVLVTGGGGSIGSELCRQIAKHNPARLIIFDIYENNAYEIQNELKAQYTDKLEIVTLIGSVRDSVRLEEIFEQYRPEIVYHAAAHKHVPLMEDSPKEAIKNNVFGTLNVVRASDRYGVKRFVMISTDKAVNPTNIMGASKRICEMIVQTQNRSSKTEFITVRFGNVLGSNGSVIPLFEKQIAEGGPVTVTDKRIVRYFMTIPEAVSLVLQAGAYGKGGEIFVLDMGKPMKIVELAENLIRLSGYEPYKDIDIEFIGLRPGEKLYEELLMAEEGMQKTPNKLIHIGKPIDIEEEQLEKNLELLRSTIEEDGDIRQSVMQVVDTYHPKD